MLLLLVILATAVHIIRDIERTGLICPPPPPCHCNVYLFSRVSTVSSVVCRVISNYGEAQSPHLIHGHHSIQAQNSDPDMSQLRGRCLMAVTSGNFVHSESKIKTIIGYQYCEAQARVRQGSGKERQGMVKGERP